MPPQSNQTVEAAYFARNPKSHTLYQRALEGIPRGVTHDVRYLEPFPLYMAEASGSRKTTVDGQELIDYAMGHGALLLGHGRPEIVEAVAEQVRRGTHYGAGHELEIAWSERIRALVPSIERVEFTASGTEATMLGMRIARAHTGRPRVMKFAGHFHGWHDYAVAGGRPPFDASHYPGVPQQTLDTVVVAWPDDLDFITHQLEQGDIAAVIVEPSGASWSAMPLSDDFLRQIRRLTEQTGTVLIFDEVITGFRWAPGGKQEACGVTPDMTALAKIVAGGLPGGAIGGRADIMGVLEFRDAAWNREKKIIHPGTFNASPLSAAAGVACLTLAETPTVQAHAADMAKRIRTGFNEVIVRRDIPGFVWGESSTFHIMLGQSCANQRGDDLHIPEGVAPEVLRVGVSGRLGYALHLGMSLEGVALFQEGGMPSAAHTIEDVDRTIEAFDTTLRRMKAEGLFNEA
jgi:glutamate-1-semialdehyde 2,1-aminomutase